MWCQEAVIVFTIPVTCYIVVGFVYIFVCKIMNTAVLEGL
jgi:hypothetical protein